MIDLAIAWAALALAVRPLGAHVARVLSGEVTFLHPALAPWERGIYRLCGVNPQVEMGWRGYVQGILLFNALGAFLLYGILLCQGALPFNPQAFPGVPADLAFNVAISFVTNTNWQSYGGENTLSYFSQMAGLAVQNFLSAATGIAVAAALFRAFSRKQSALIGNVWADMTRALLYILLPLAVVFAVILVGQGVVQTFGQYVAYAPLESVHSESSVAVGPVASQVAIKMLGSNGGGFFNANSAHPFENPTPFSNLLEMVAILLLPTALVYAFGVMVKDRRQGYALLATMLLVFVPLVALASWQEVHAAFSMEGKEVRFGPLLSAFWSAATTATSNGSVNAAHDSFQPLSVLAQMALMQMGEVIFGGVGSGMYGMMVFVILTVFLGGLMVGRTPEYLGKKLGPFEIKMASLAVIVPCAATLVGTAVALMTEAGRAGVLNPGPRGFSEVLYAFTSAANNNGSALAGLQAGTPFYNVSLAVVMFLGRFFVIVPVLAMAGSIAAKNTVPQGLGTLPTHLPMFVLMLAGVIVIVGLLTYMPALALGPLAGHLEMMGAGG